ncbi:MAG: MATE family efflux transporter [Roseburia sp.]|jgi:putative MATE family efflux protein|nr:MATE family efflux transporter [Roseburia sp.]
MNRDLTTGKTETVLWRFCLPLFGSIVFQQLYNIADSLIAGKLIGERALAAVGNSYEITLIFIAFAFGCNMGCSVIVSQLFGAKDYKRLLTAVTTASLAGLVLCGLLMISGLLGARSLLALIQTPQEVFADSILYLNIYVWGLPFVFFYNIATGIFSAMGDSKTPFYFLAASSLSNIAVDILFVKTFDMGVAGVAWATFLCQGISCILAVIAVCRRLFKLPVTGGKPALFDRGLLAKIMVVAVPSILQQSFISVGNILIQSVINGFGAPVMAGYSAAVKLNNLVVTSFTTVGNGISNFSAQNLGARKYDRLLSCFHAGRKMVWSLCVPFVILYLFFGRPLLLLFMKEGSDAAMTAGIQFLRVLSPFYFVVSLKLTADGILRGVSAMRPFMIATFTDLILRVSFAFVLSGLMHSTLGIWFAWPVGWSVATVCSVLFYRREYRRITSQ